MSTEIKILAVPMATEIAPETAAILAEKGVVILRSDSPELVRLVTPSSDVDMLPANEFMWAALDALQMTNKAQYSQPDAKDLRQRFVSNLAETATAKRRKLIGWSKPDVSPDQISAPSEAE